VHLKIDSLGFRKNIMRNIHSLKVLWLKLVGKDEAGDHYRLGASELSISDSNDRTTSFFNNLGSSNT